MSKKFRFSLEPVLKLRAHTTEQAKQALGRAALARQQQETALQHADERLALHAQEILGGEQITPLALRRREARRQALHVDFEAARNRLEKMRGQEKQARATLMSHRRDEEAISTLHDREKTEHEQAAEERERSFLDEQALTVFNRKRSAQKARSST